MLSHAPDPFDHIALTAAINLLRDSLKSGKLPSGLPLDHGTADLHRQAAEHLEHRRQQLAWDASTSRAG
jgi:hypothetical protein